MRRRGLAIAVAALGLCATMPPGAALAATTPPPVPTPVLSPGSPLPTCQPWQTVTVVPATGAAGAAGTSSPGATATAPTTVPGVAVCRNAPPVPFPAPALAPDSVVGGSRLAATGVVVDAPRGTPAPPDVPDVSWVIADAETGSVLAAKAPHAWLRPASTLKTLTAVTLLPRLAPTQVVTATPEMVAANGTRAGMLAGNPYPVSALWDGLLMFSANDCAYGLAEAAGGYETTLRLMNEQAARLGAYDTVAKDPSGLDEDGQRSSAYDLALFGRAALRIPEFRMHATKLDAVFPGGTDAQGKVYEPFHIYNINTLLTHYPGANGIKPGRTNRAQHTFIGSATRNGRTLIVTQMGSVTGRWQDTAALLDWGFAHAAAVSPVGRLVEAGEARRPVPLPSLTSLPGTTTAPGSTGAASSSAPTSRPDAAGATGPGTAASVPTLPAPTTDATATTPTAAAPRRDLSVVGVGVATVLLGLALVTGAHLRARRRRPSPPTG